jgi:peptidoglycan hydrolase-like protein with peptidoglycan-binding domain
MTPARTDRRALRPLAVLLVVFCACALAPSAFARGEAIGLQLRGLEPGASGPAVRTLQRTLSKLGYGVKSDGQFGRHTALAVRAFRADTGMPRSSRVTKRFVRFLRRAQNGGPGDLRWLGIRRLAVGARGHDVRLLQKDLTRLGFVASADGQYGPLTRVSVRRFERSAGLVVDGVISPKEASKIKKIAKAGVEAGAVSRRPATTTQTQTQTPAGSAGATSAVPPTAPPAAPQDGADPAIPSNLPMGQQAPPPPAVATIGADGLAIPPAGAPVAVVQIIEAGNRIAKMPYRYGGGHEAWADTGYDCSGSVSYALHGAGLLDTPLSSYDFPTWGLNGPGQWVTVYGNLGHAYMVVAGLRFDTSASKGGGSRWTTAPRSPAGYIASHPTGL